MSSRRFAIGWAPFVVAALYATACTAPAVHFPPDGGPPLAAGQMCGWEVLVFLTPKAVALAEVEPSWRPWAIAVTANLVWLVGWSLLVIRANKGALIAGVIALGMAVGSWFPPALLEPLVHILLPGYTLWMGSMAALVAAAWWQRSLARNCGVTGSARDKLG